MRRNGFECPLGFWQLTSWVFAVYILGSFILTAICLFQREQSDQEAGLITLTVLYTISYTAMAISTVLVTKSDPSDPSIYLDRYIIDSNQTKNEQLTSVIAQNSFFYCNICRGHVIMNTKHCSACNRCTYEFDHHCCWINNDIGLNNYILFLRMLACVIVTLLVQIA